MITLKTPSNTHLETVQQHAMMMIQEIKGMDFPIS